MGLGLGFWGWDFQLTRPVVLGLLVFLGLGALYIYIHRRLTLGKKLCKYKYHLVSDRYYVLIYLRCTCTQSFVTMALLCNGELPDHKRAEFVSPCGT